MEHPVRLHVRNVTETARPVAEEMIVLEDAVVEAVDQVVLETVAEAAKINVVAVDQVAVVDVVVDAKDVMEAVDLDVREDVLAVMEAVKVDVTDDALQSADLAVGQVVLEDVVAGVHHVQAAQVVLAAQDVLDVQEHALENAIMHVNRRQIIMQ